MKMNRKIKQILLAFFVTFLILGNFYVFLINRDYGKFRNRTCETGLKGVIIRVVNNRTEYITVAINDSNNIYSLDMYKITYLKGFIRSRHWQVGDSIFKSAHSELVRVTKGDSVCEFKIKCD